MNKFIVFEGLDGSGKSEVSKLIAKKLGGILLKTPPQEITTARHYIDSSDDEVLRFHYYMIGNMIVSEKSEKLRKQGEIVICDRYVYSTLVYFKFFGLNINQSQWQDTCCNPDIKIFLDVSYQQRMKRMGSRNCNTSFDEKTKSQVIHDGLRKLYLEFPDWLMIDTDEFDGNIIEEVDWIVSKLRPLL